MKTNFLTIGLAIASWLTSHMEGQNLLINGSFEQPPSDIPLTFGYAYVSGARTSIPGWTTLYHGVEYVTPNQSNDGIHNIYVGLASDGNCCIDLPPVAWVGGGGIEQTFPTVTGATYVVSFYMGNYVGFGRDGTGTLSVTAANITKNFTFTTTASYLQWMPQSFAFTAVAEFTTLAFWSMDDPIKHFSSLDNVSVNLLHESPRVSIQRYPAIHINGVSGHTYVLEYSTPPETTLNQLQYVTLPVPSNLVFDVTSPQNFNREYRAFELLPDLTLGDEVSVTVAGIAAGIGLTGTPGQNYIIQYSDDLLPSNWQPLQNVTLTTDSTLMFDPNSISSIRRFYRASWTE